jgi:hypothetical protein
MRNPVRRISSASSAVARALIRLSVLLGAGLFLLQMGPIARCQVQPTLRDLVGVNHNIGQDWSQKLGVGWGRASALWMTVEAQQGKYDWTTGDKDVQGVISSGDQAVILLAYTPAWDQTIKSTGQAPPRDLASWPNFVQAAVTRYSAAPYNVKYFQIWNEPTQKATFWLGTNQQYIDAIYIPAAKVIRQHGCYVVFGGWPQSNSVQELDTVLNYHNAWQWTDIVDMHYRLIGDMQHEYAQWVASGKCRGIWQTEIGWNTDPEFVEFYPQVLAWTLQVGWRDPNEFKLFWYTNYAGGADGSKCLLRVVGQTFEPSEHGSHLVAINQALGGGPISLFKQFSSQPVTTPNFATVNGFSVGSNRTTIQFVLARSYVQSKQAFTASVSLPSRPSKVQLMSGEGKTWDLPVQYSGGRLQVNAPLHADFDDCKACHWVYGFVVIDH